MNKRLEKEGNKKDEKGKEIKKEMLHPFFLQNTKLANIRVLFRFGGELNRAAPFVLLCVRSSVEVSLTRERHATP